MLRLYNVKIKFIQRFGVLLWAFRSAEFVLLLGHLDGWHFGVGDYATGDATMLEVARVLW